MGTAPTPTEVLHTTSDQTSTNAQDAPQIPKSLAPLLNATDLPVDGLTLPDPTKADLKWQEKFDNTYQKKQGRVDSSSLRMEFIKYLKTNQLWRAYHILNTRYKSDDPDQVLNFTDLFGFTVDSVNDRICKLYTDNKIMPEARILAIAGGSPLGHDLYDMKAFLKSCSMQTVFQYLRHAPHARKNTCLELSASIGTLEDFKYILSMGANINDSPDTLNNAIEKQDLAFVKFIVEHGGDISLNNYECLAVAKSLGKDDIHAYLIEQQEQKTQQKKLKAPPKNNTSQWSTIDSKTVEWNQPSSDSGIRTTYQINFYTEMITALFRDNNRNFTATPPQRFDALQNQKIIYDAALHLQNEGHDVTDLDHIFQAYAQKYKKAECIIPKSVSDSIKEKRKKDALSQ